MKKELNLIGYIIIYIVFAFCNFLCAQDYIIDCSRDNVSPPPQHFSIDEQSKFTIGFSDEIPLSCVTWSYCESYDALGNCTRYNNISISPGLIPIEFNENADILELTVQPTGINYDVKFKVRINTSDEIGCGEEYDCNREVEFNFILRHPIDLVFVLDRSGSMECTDCELTDWPGCADTEKPNRRWDRLIDAVEEFVSISNWSDNMIIDNRDSLGVVYFSGSSVAAASGASGLSRWENVSIFRDRIKENMSSPPRENDPPTELARDGTGIGIGLVKAVIDLFNREHYDDKRQIIILFTDGEENRNTIEIGSERRVNDLDGRAINLDDEVRDDIELFTLAANSVPPSGSDILSGLASDDSHTPGNNKPWYNGPHDYSPDVGLSNFHKGLSINIFNDIFNAYGSPELIYTEEQLINTSNRFSVFSNDGVSRLVFKAHFEKPLADKLSYTLKKDGNIIYDSLIISNIGKYYASFSVEIQKLARDNITSLGTWTLEVNNIDTIIGINEHKLCFSAIADDHNIDLNVNFGDNLRVNDKIKPVLGLKYKNNPVTNATVKMFVIKPGDDIGDILARAENISLDTSLEAGGFASQKLLHLQKNNPSALDAYLNLQRDSVMLDHQENGLYTGESAVMDVVGTYKVIFYIHADIPETGRLERMKEQSVYVRFGEINRHLNLKDQKVIIIPATPTSPAKAVITIKPAYKISDKIRFIGPGYNYAFSVEGTGVLTDNVTDNGDGSYTLKLTLNEGENPDIKLTMLSEEIYTGKLNKFDKRICPQWIRITLVLVLIIVMSLLFGT